MTGRNDEVRTSGYRADDGDFIVAYWAKPGKESKPTKPGKKRYSPGERLGVIYNFIQRNSVFKPHKLRVAAKIKIAACCLLDI